MKQYDYVLFDWDGTIVKTLDIWMGALQSTLIKRGYAFTDKQVGADYELFKVRFSELGKDTLESLINEALMASNSITPTVQLYESLFEALVLLKQREKRLGVVTTSTHSVIDRLLAKHGLGQLFDAVVCGDNVLHQKPHAEPIEKAISALSAIKSRTVMVGDSDKDIIAARNAGIDSILFYPPEHARFHDIKYLMSLKPTYVLESFREIGRLLM